MHNPPPNRSKPAPPPNPPKPTEGAWQALKEMFTQPKRSKY